MSAESDAGYRDTIYTGGSHPSKLEIEAPYLELPVVDVGKAPKPVSKGNPLPPLRVIK